MQTTSSRPPTPTWPASWPVTSTTLTSATSATLDHIAKSPASCGDVKALKLGRKVRLAARDRLGEIQAGGMVGAERVLADRRHLSSAIQPEHRGVHRLAGLRRRPTRANGAPRALPHDFVDVAEVGVHVVRRRPRCRSAAQRPAGLLAEYPFEQVTDAPQPRVVLPPGVTPRPRQVLGVQLLAEPVACNAHPGQLEHAADLSVARREALL